MLLGIGDTGMMIAMLIGYGFVAVGLGLLAEGWREVYRARQEDRLITDGLYAFVRHPQYLGLFLALFGEGVVHWPTLFSVGLFPIIVVVYYLLARKEERAVLAKFGDQYGVHMSQVPMFIPRRGQWRRLIHASGQESA